ncbi:MAG: c-type cytochrome domain-containing protein [Luteolibacter sp.]
MAETDPHFPRLKKPWALTFFGLLAVGGLIAMPLLAGRPDGAKMPDIVRFIGHFHPVLLHLPIGVFSLILFQELAAIFGKRSPEPRNTSMFPMFFGAASAILAVIAGFLLFHGHGEDYGNNAIAERHLWGGLIFAVAAVITFIVKSWTVALGANPAFFRLLLFGSVGVMAFASHDGATITHGEGYLTQYAPAPLRKLLGIDKAKPAVPAKSGNEQLVYADIVAPILERRCVQCHKESKAKGKLRMDSFEMLAKGGKDGPAIEIGNAAKSHIIERIELPKDDEDHMPPEGKPAIEAHEIAILKWWIDNGADPAKKIGDFDPPAPIKDAIGKLVPAGAIATPGSSKDQSKPLSAGPDAALQSSMAALSKEFPGAASFESQGSGACTFTAVSLRGNFDDAGFNKLEKLLPYLVTLDLSSTKITDRSVAMLASAGQLRMIRLAETGVTDASIDTLLKLPALESINLYGTKLHLKRLYLWQTAVTPEAIKSLKGKLPSCEIITGI